MSKTEPWTQFKYVVLQSTTMFTLHSKQGPQATAALRMTEVKKTSQGCHTCNWNAEHTVVKHPAAHFIQISMTKRKLFWVGQDNWSKPNHFKDDMALLPSGKCSMHLWSRPQGKNGQWSSTHTLKTVELHFFIIHNFFCISQNTTIFRHSLHIYRSDMFQPTISHPQAHNNCNTLKKTIYKYLF